MGEYIKREDAIKAVSANNMERELDSVNDASFYRCHRAAERCIAAVPAADVVEVVRCKDCAHSYEDIIYINGVAACGRCCSCGPCCDSPVDDDFFCRHGEPKSGTGEDENEF